MVTPHQPESFPPQGNYPVPQGYPYPQQRPEYPPPGFGAPPRAGASPLDWITAGLLVLSAILAGIWRFTNDYLDFGDHIPFLLTAAIAVVAAIILVTGAGAKNGAFRALAAVAAGALFAPALSFVVSMAQHSEYVEAKDFGLGVPAALFALGASVAAIIASARSSAPRTPTPPHPPQWQQPIAQQPPGQYPQYQYPPHSSWPPR
ncbi:hypothetical protein ACQP0C_23980 [Nocardia sp. CA-129566]|uniref:hypothetical protein n=1 Tax=Nocardia sp. CA-129566 TaxID=3239976 RepID=UPI003D99AC94